MGDRLTEIKDKFDVEITHIPDRDIRWLLDEIETLRAAAHGDQVVIQRLRREADHWVAIGGAATAENYRLAALTGSVATEAEALKRERDDYRTLATEATQTAIEASNEMREWQRLYEDAQTKLAQANQRAASRGGRVPR